MHQGRCAKTHCLVKICLQIVDHYGNRRGVWRHIGPVLEYAAADALRFLRHEAVVHLLHKRGPPAEGAGVEVVKRFRVASTHLEVHNGWGIALWRHLAVPFVGQRVQSNGVVGGVREHGKGTHAGRNIRRRYNRSSTHPGQLIQGCLQVIHLDVEGHVIAGRHVIGGFHDTAADAAFVGLRQTVVAHLPALRLHIPAEEVPVELLQGGTVGAGDFKMDDRISHCSS